MRQVGTPAAGVFKPDHFQVEAIAKLELSDVLVSAPTGSGKTYIAEQAIAHYLAHGQKVWYASPLKALSNAKLLEFGALFGSGKVGILTGDRKENVNAPLIVGTTEILRNQLYDAMHQGQDLPFALVVLDEAHYLGDADRGVVWEEVLIYLPSRIRLLLLSATIANSGQLAGWLTSIRNAPCQVVYSGQRPVPLKPLFLFPDGQLTPLHDKKGQLLPLAQRFASKEKPGHPSLPNAVRALDQFNLLPAIFFLKSRADCENAIKQAALTPLCIEDECRARLQKVVKDFLNRFPFLERQESLPLLLDSHLAAHHAGLLPHFKLLVETLMQQGLLKAIFSTSTVAAGVNFPARTVVINQSDRFTGHEFSKLSASDLTQMTGRAGRRGMDNVGFCLLLPGPFQDLAYMAKLFGAQPEPIISQLNINFSMTLNLLLSHQPLGVRQLLKLSLAAWQNTSQDKRHVAARPEGAAVRLLNGALCSCVEEVLVRARQLRAVNERKDQLQQLNGQSPAALGRLQALARGRVFTSSRMLPFAVLRKDFAVSNPGVWAVALLPEKKLLRTGSARIEFVALEDIYRISQVVLELPPEEKTRALARAVLMAEGDFKQELSAAQLTRLGHKGKAELEQKLEELAKRLALMPCGQCPKYAACLNRSSSLSRTVEKLLPQVSKNGAEGLWFEFVRHLEFLRSEGYVDYAGKLTADGQWASRLRLSQPMLVAEAIREGALPTEKPVLLSALLAWMADGRENTIGYLDDELAHSCASLRQGLQPLFRRLQAFGFAVPPLSLAAASAIFAWGQMAELEQVGEIYGGGEGDVAQLIYRVADNLRQLTNLEDTHPQLAACAYQAAETMIRPPILLPA